MHETQIRTLEDIEQFLAGMTGTSLQLQGSKDDVYGWIERTLVRLRYLWLGKKQRGVVRRYIRQLSGYSIKSQICCKFIFRQVWICHLMLRTLVPG